jgi:hypothetical protein
MRRTILFSKARNPKFIPPSDHHRDGQNRWGVPSWLNQIFPTHLFRISFASQSCTRHNLVDTGEEFQSRLGVYVLDSQIICECNSSEDSFSFSISKLVLIIPNNVSHLKSLFISICPNSIQLSFRCQSVHDDWDWQVQYFVLPPHDQGQCRAI